MDEDNAVSVEEISIKIGECSIENTNDSSYERTQGSMFVPGKDDFFENPETEFQSFETHIQNSSNYFSNVRLFNNEDLRDAYTSNHSKHLVCIDKLILLVQEDLHQDGVDKLLQHLVSSKSEEKSHLQGELQLFSSELPLLLQETKTVRQNIIETCYAFRHATKCYKQFLDIYIGIEKNDADILIINLYFFSTKANKDYYCTLMKRHSGETWNLEKVVPDLSSEDIKYFQKKLAETNDIATFVRTIRNKFKEVKEREKLITQD